MEQYFREWGSLKDALSDLLHVSHTVLHIHVGLLVLVLACAVLRRPLGGMLPLLIVTLLELANEGVDFACYQLAGWPWTPNNTIDDIAATLAWPLILTLSARTGLLTVPGKSPSGSEPVSDEDQS